MEQYNYDVDSEYNGDNLFDGSMLDKLRNCSIIPRRLTDFQVFVRRLTGDTISDTVVQEVWKNIYENEQALITPEIESESGELKLPTAVVGDKNITTFTSQSLDSDSNKVTSEGFSHSGVRIFRNENESCSENEVDDCVIKHNKQFASAPCEKWPPNKDLCNDRNEVSPSHSTVSNSKKKVKRRLPYFPAIRIPQQMKGSETENAMDDNVILEKEQKGGGDSSSDCEVIEIVSLHKTNSGVSSDTSFTEPENFSECDESHSEKSVEILEPLYNTEQIVELSLGNVCPIHGDKGLFYSQSSQVNYSNSEEISNCIDADEQKDYNHKNIGTYQNSVNKEKQRKVKQGKRDNKYEILRTEVQCLKSLLVNLLTTLKSPTSDNRGKKIELPSQVNLPHLLGNNQRRRKKKRSFLKEKYRVQEMESEVESTKELKVPAFVEVNMSRKATMVHQKKQQNLKHAKSCNKAHESFPKLDSNTRYFDNGKRKKFLWRESITDTLKLKTSKKMSVEELKRSVIAKYYYNRGNVSQNTSVKFFRYLHSTTGVVVDGDVVSYSNKQATKVSSKCEQKEKFVMKTVTTTKEYKVS